MKRCSNPNCDSAFLYGDDKTVCPFCHGTLIGNEEENEESFLRPADRIPGLEPVHRHAVQFVQERFGTMECRGRIVEIDHQEFFNSKPLKLINTLFRGEPYQFAHQTVEYTIRVESLTDEFPAEVKDFCMYGNYLGRIQVGDEVVIRAKNLRHRRVVKAIYNRTTDTAVKPGFQIPAAVVRIPVAVLWFILITLMCSIVWWVKSGAAAIMLSSLFAAIAAVIIQVLIVLGIIILILSFIPSGRRR